jgi:hypothetical protein
VQDERGVLSEPVLPIEGKLSAHDGKFNVRSLAEPSLSYYS